MHIPTPAPSPLTDPDPLDDFTPRIVDAEGVAKTVHVAGTGPAVIVMPETPGISPQLARFARWVRDAGFTAWMPSLFGRDGASPGVEEAVDIFRRTCVAAEFRALGAGGQRPIASWLRTLARLAHAECGGPGVGAIGMCFTGNFALSMMLEPAVLAPVLCQPSMPLEDPAALDSPPGELAAVRARLLRDDLIVRAYRFDGDRFCTGQRFAAYAAALGDRFEPRVLPDASANTKALPPFFEHVVRGAHSVVTVHLVDEAGQPTRAARDEILGFLARRLRPRSP
jgi:dienelactone hydrolase